MSRWSPVSAEEVEKLARELSIGVIEAWDTTPSGPAHLAYEAASEVLRPHVALLVRAREVLRHEHVADHPLGRSCSEWGYDNEEPCPYCLLLSDLDKLVRPVRKEDR